MEALLTQAFLSSLLFGAVTAGVPLMFAGLGEQISEKAGVLNIGIEGMMLFGAYTGFVAAYYSGSFWLGFLAGGIGGMAVALFMVVLCIRLGLNQIVIGIALTLGAEGLTALLHYFQFSRTYPRLSQAPVLPIPGLSQIPVLGPALFSHNAVVYIGVLLVAGLTWLFRRSHVGLKLEAAGSKPAALDAAGVSVLATRSWAVLATGFLTGVGGAYLANVGAGLFIPFMTNGAGFIGIALTLGAEGLTALLHYFQFSRTYPRLSQAPVLPIPGLSQIPVLGPALFSHNAVVYLGVLLVAGLTWLFRRSHIGLNLEAAGSKPAALDAAGVSVLATRSWAVLATGFLTGVGGAYLANVGAGLFIPFMTNGAGFIGIVLAMLARGRPVWVLAGAALFGVSLALTTALQVAGVNIPTDVVQMLPFAMVMLVLVIFARHSVLPPALGLPYLRGDR